MTVDEKYDQINLAMLNKISKVKGFSEEKCGVLTLNLFREHLYKNLGAEDSAVVKNIRKSGVQDDFMTHKILLIALMNILKILIATFLNYLTLLEIT